MTPDELVWIGFSLLVTFVIWLTLCFVVAWAAHTKGKSVIGVIGMFVVSLFLTPLVGLIIVAFMKINKTLEVNNTIESMKELEERKLELGIAKKCPICAEFIKIEAIKCRYCGHDNSSKEKLEFVTAMEDEPTLETKPTMEIREKQGVITNLETKSTMETKPITTCPVCGGTDVFIEDGYCETCKRTTFKGEWEIKLGLNIDD